MAELQDRVAVVTGAGRGIGRTIAQALAKEGMKVGLNDIDPKNLESAVAELRSEGLKVFPLPGDVSRKGDVSTMIAMAEAELGPIWLLVNNAGVLSAAPTANLSEESWDRVFAVDVKGVFLCSQEVIKRMMPRKKGRIINMSSIAGFMARSEQIAYCSAKAAVIHFTRCLAVEMAPHGITVNCLCPGGTRTKMLVDSVRERGFNFDDMVQLIPAGRMAEEIDHANLIVFLASDKSAHLTGQIISVDGAQGLYSPFMPKIVFRDK